MLHLLSAKDSRRPHQDLIRRTCRGEAITQSTLIQGVKPLCLLSAAQRLFSLRGGTSFGYYT